MCDDAREPEKVATHLVSELRVPAIIGFALSKEVADLAESHFNPNGVLALASNTSNILRNIPHQPGEPRLVWRTTTSSDMEVAPRAAILSDVVEPLIRATPGMLTAGAPLKLALVRIGNTSGQGLSDRFVAALRFNGKTVVENGESFREIVNTDYNDREALHRDVARMAAEIVAFRPHVVIVDCDEPLIPAVEEAWPKGERFRPLYLGGRTTHPDMRAFVHDHPEVGKRIFDSDTLTSTPAVAKHVLRHNQVFEHKITAAAGHGATYDAFYLLAYAIAATADQPLTGRAIARSIPRLLPPGDPVDVGPGGIYDVFHALASGKNVDLAGTTTTLDFDLETGDATADFSVFCATPNGPTESGMIFRGRTGKLEGTMRCP
jgi:branched-chain amino acid transport system substrate-binding protein